MFATVPKRVLLPQFLCAVARFLITYRHGLFIHLEATRECEVFGHLLKALHPGRRFPRLGLLRTEAGFDVRFLLQPLQKYQFVMILQALL